VGERLRKSTVLNDVAIVLTTAYKLTPDEEKVVMKTAGADKLIYKPLPKFAELQGVLEDVIAARREQKAKSNNKDGKSAAAKPEEKEKSAEAETDKK